MCFFKKSKKEKELDKAFDEEIERMIKEEEEAEKNAPKEKLNIIELLTEKDTEDEELKAYMSEEDKEEALKEQKYVKRLTIVSVSLIVILVGGIITGLFFLNYAMQSDLIKEVIPKMEEYYLNKYGVSTKIEKKNIKEICHDEVDSEGKKNEVCDGKVLAVANDGTYIFSLDKENFNDDKSNKSVMNSYNDKIKSFFSEVDFIGNDPIISYKDFYDYYNSAIPYIDILPNGKTFDELYSTNKLTIRDMILYSGDINFYEMKSFLENLSDDSVIIFVNTLRGIPETITVFKNNSLVSYNLGNRSLITDDIAYYELDTTINGTPNLNVTKVLENDISSKYNYSLITPYKITFNKPRVGRDEEPKTNYYFVEINSELLSIDNMVEFNANGSGNYRELDYNNYVDYVKLSLGNSTYIFGDTPIGIAGVRFNNKNKCYFEFC